MNNDDWKTLQTQFKLTCRKCGSENVVVDASTGWMGTEWTGWISGWLSVGCNDCKDNDFHAEN